MTAGKRVRMWRMAAVIMALGWMLLALPACAEEQVRVEDDGSSYARVAGWYRIGHVEEVLVSFASDGNLLIYHFGEPPYANRLKRNADGTLVWTRGEGKLDRIVKVSSDGSEHRALQWREDGGPWNRSEGIAGPYDVVERRFHSHGVPLSATVFVPSTSGPHPGVVFIHGSGASTRDNFWYVWIADRLARNGIAVLLPDKRGTGKSGGDWEIASFHDFAADAAAGVAALRQIESVAPGRIGVLGVSQGGHIAPMVPELVADLAFVVNLSGSAVPIEEQLRLELTNTLREEGWPRFLIPLARPVAVRVVKNRRPVWWEKNGKLDPIPYWSRLAIPALIVYGAEDEQDNVPVRRSIERLRRADREDSRQQLEIIVYPDSGHALYAPGTHRIREDFLQTLVDWIHGATHASLE
jgi:pimeloyl-ACP methyl ester carboxylesterase